MHDLGIRLEIFCTHREFNIMGTYVQGGNDQGMRLECTHRKLNIMGNGFIEGAGNVGVCKVCMGFNEILDMFKDKKRQIQLQYIKDIIMLPIAAVQAIMTS